MGVSQAEPEPQPVRKAPKHAADPVLSGMEGKMVGRLQPLLYDPIQRYQAQEKVETEGARGSSAVVQCNNREQAQQIADPGKGRENGVVGERRGGQGSTTSS